ncbi:MAG: sialidase family protein [Pirellulaceae bacterium]|nr:exo-alpha-sialidase [Planctomycetales bacterium]
MDWTTTEWDSSCHNSTAFNNATVGFRDRAGVVHAVWAEGSSVKTNHGTAPLFRDSGPVRQPTILSDSECDLVGAAWILKTAENTREIRLLAYTGPRVGWQRNARTIHRGSIEPSLAGYAYSPGLEGSHAKSRILLGWHDGRNVWVYDSQTKRKQNLSALLRDKSSFITLGGHQANVCAAWNCEDNRTIMFRISADGGVTWDRPRVLLDAPPVRDPSVVVTPDGTLYLGAHMPAAGATGRTIHVFKGVPSTGGEYHWEGLGGGALDDGRFARVAFDPVAGLWVAYEKDALDDRIGLRRYDDATGSFLAESPAVAVTSPFPSVAVSPTKVDIFSLQPCPGPSPSEKEGRFVYLGAEI